MTHRKINNNVVVLVLLVLMIVMVGLIVANVVVLTRGEDDMIELGDDNLAKDCLQKDNEESMENCLNDRAFDYFMDNDCENALKVYEDVPADRLDKRLVSHLYDEAHSLSMSCDDESLQEYWEDKLNKSLGQLEAGN